QWMNTVLISLVALLITVLGFLLKGRLGRIEADIADNGEELKKKADKNDINRVIDDLKEKADKNTIEDIKDSCIRTHEGVDKLLHRHADTGSVGQAVYK
ncbi:MAG: hypothetical protein V1906_03210, partial [Candidatus Woesearchaeota archaeon]